MRPEGRGWCILCAALPVFLSFFLPLFYTSPPLFYTSPLFFSFPSFSFLHGFLICFFFFLSPLSPSFSPLLLLLVFFSLCLSPLSPFPLFFFQINHFLFHPHLFPFFFFSRVLLVLCALREFLVLCAFRELLLLCALRELLVLYTFYDVIEDTIDCNQP